MGPKSKSRKRRVASLRSSAIDDDEVADDGAMERLAESLENVDNTEGELLGVLDEMYDQQTQASTKGTYSGRIKLFVTWAEVNLPAILDSQKCVIVPIPPSCYKGVLTFFGTLFANAQVRHKLPTGSQINEDVHPEPFSISTVEGYRSALVNLHDSVKPASVAFPQCKQSLINYKIISKINLQERPPILQRKFQI